MRGCVESGDGRKKQLKNRSKLDDSITARGIVYRAAITGFAKDESHRFVADFIRKFQRLQGSKSWRQSNSQTDQVTGIKIQKKRRRRRKNESDIGLLCGAGRCGDVPYSGKRKLPYKLITLTPGAFLRCVVDAGSIATDLNIGQWNLDWSRFSERPVDDEVDRRECGKKTTSSERPRCARCLRAGNRKDIELILDESMRTRNRISFELVSWSPRVHAGFYFKSQQFVQIEAL